MIIKESTVDYHRFNNLLRNIKQFADEIQDTLDNDLYDDEELKQVWDAVRVAEDKLFKASKII